MSSDAFHNRKGVVAFLTSLREKSKETCEGTLPRLVCLSGRQCSFNLAATALSACAGTPEDSAVHQHAHVIWRKAYAEWQSYDDDLEDGGGEQMQ